MILPVVDAENASKETRLHFTDLIKFILCNSVFGFITFHTVLANLIRQRSWYVQTWKCLVNVALKKFHCYVALNNKVVFSCI